MNVKVPNDQGPRESAMCEALAAAAALPKFMVGIPTTLQDPCAAAGLVRHSRGPLEGHFRAAMIIFRDGGRGGKPLSAVKRGIKFLRKE